MTVRLLIRDSWSAIKHRYALPGRRRAWYQAICRHLCVEEAAPEEVLDNQEQPRQQEALQEQEQELEEEQEQPPVVVIPDEEPTDEEPLIDNRAARRRLRAAQGQVVGDDETRAERAIADITAADEADEPSGAREATVAVPATPIDPILLDVILIESDDEDEGQGDEDGEAFFSLLGQEQNTARTHRVTSPTPIFEARRVFTQPYVETSQTAAALFSRLGEKSEVLPTPRRTWESRLPPDAPKDVRKVTRHFDKSISKKRKAAEAVASRFIENYIKPDFALYQEINHKQMRAEQETYR
ncbi:hypothetical protein BGZ75_000643, partial [Mortierella antarctica]